MTQQELARLAGISRSTVLHIVRGGHSGTETLERVAGALESTSPSCSPRRSIWACAATA